MSQIYHTVKLVNKHMCYPVKDGSIICILCVGVWSFICMHDCVKLLSLNDICLCPYHVLFWFYICTNYTHVPNLESVYCFQIIFSHLCIFLEANLSTLCSARCRQPIVLPMPMLLNALAGQIWHSFWWVKFNIFC